MSVRHYTPNGGKSRLPRQSWPAEAASPTQPLRGLVPQVAPYRLPAAERTCGSTVSRTKTLYGQCTASPLPAATTWGLAWVWSVWDYGQRPDRRNLIRIRDKKHPQQAGADFISAVEICSGGPLPPPSSLEHHLRPCIAGGVHAPRATGTTRPPAFREPLSSHQPGRLRSPSSAYTERLDRFGLPILPLPAHTQGGEKRQDHLQQERLYPA